MEELQQGGLIRDEDGRILEMYQSYLGESSILVAELYGVWQGLKICIRNNWTNIVAETDSQVAVTMISSEVQQRNWKVINILDKIKKLVALYSVQVLHQYREGNSPADWIANEALTSGISKTWERTTFPIAVRKLAYSNKSGLPYIRRSK